ncbi:MAG TPA: DUF4145 domain-containing protein [Gemmataceae bacterium]|nr:DUF4145 domain-containing protein [Gemmataceae bacterium]
MQDLDRKVRLYQQALPKFSEDIQLACDYVEPDAASSLTKSRIVMEKLLIDVYQREMGHEPRKPLLGEILNDNQFTRKLDRRILSRMNAIRDMGNLGPHGERVEASDAARVLDDLCVILDWYLQHYTQGISGSGSKTGLSSESGTRPRRQKKLSANIFVRNAGCSVVVALSLLVAVLSIPLLSRMTRTGPIPTTRPPEGQSAPFKGSIDILVWEKGNPERMGKHLHQAGVLPLLGPKSKVNKGDGLRIEAELNRPGYMYIVWLDAGGSVSPVYPWQDHRWDKLPADQKKRERLSWPENTSGLPVQMDPGPSGVESLILLVREEPWPSDRNMATLFTGLPKPAKVRMIKGEIPKVAVWFENGEIVRDEPDRGAINSKRIMDPSDPTLYVQNLLKEKLKPEFPYSRAVCFSVQGE